MKRLMEESQTCKRLPTPMRDEASKKDDDLYDAEEHVCSVVNTKCNKRVNQEREEGGEGENTNSEDSSADTM